MLKSYFTIALRNFRHNKLFSLINIAGLAIGISASLVIYLIVQHELSYDKFHKERVYRVVSTISFPDMTMQNSGVPVPTVKALKDEATGIENQTHFITGQEMKVSIPVAGSDIPTIFRRQPDIIFADQAYFNLFPYQWLAGSPAVALRDPFAVVLTESRAESYFGKTSPADIIGKEIVYDDSLKMTVVGVVADIKKATDFTFKEFISRATLENTGLKDHFGWEEWGSINSASQFFVQLKKGVSTAQIEKQLAIIRDKHREKNKDNALKDDTRHALQPITDIHFNADYDAFGQRQGNRNTLYGLLAVAAFLLLLGCINFINLTTAQASQRAKEIGIRKTMGSSKIALVRQFLSETFLLTLLATVLSIVIAPWLLNIFGDFIPKGISFTSLSQPHVWLFLLLIMVLVTLLAGGYPAWVLSRFKPVTVLKNQAFSGTAQTRKAWLRKTLTITQFVIAQFLIIATIVVSKQVHYSVNKELGYKKDAIVSFNTRWDFFSGKPDTRRFALMEKLKAIPGIQLVSLSGAAPASNNTSSTTMKFTEGKTVNETMVEVKYADSNYFPIYGLKLIAGRQLQQSDTIKEYIINETYARFLGFEKPGEAVGHSIDKDFKVPIVGVVKDFHTKSTRQAIKPLVYSSAFKSSYVIHLALPPQGGPKRWNETLEQAGKAFKEIYPEDEFNYSFYDKSIASFYTEEKNISRLLTWAAGLCIFISCLGLLGLVIYITNTRTKEIGVRKVLGASVPQLVSLLSKDFVVLVLVAFFITLPFAWWAMHNWLQDFVYRTSLSWWVFAITGAGMLLIAMIILSIRTVRSAMDNPVKSLRTE